MTSGDNVVNRTIAVLLLAGTVILLAGVSVGFLATDASIAGDPGTSASGSTEQRDPAEVGGEGSLSPVERQLAQQAAGRLRSGSINISSGDYDQVKRSLEDSQYGDLLDRYAEVASQTGNKNRAELLRSLRENQRDYATAADAYWQLYRVYNDTANLSTEDNRTTLTNLRFVNESNVNASINRSLRSAGPNATITPGDVISFNDSEYQRLARALDNRSRRADETGTDLVRNYRRLAENSATNYSAAIESVREDRENIVETQQVVRETWLTVVSIAARTDDPQGSFIDPIRVDGRLTLQNDTALASERIRMRIGAQTYRAQTDMNGEFTVPYRPATIPLNATNATARFVPNSSSAYTTVETNVSINVTQIQPTVDVDVKPSEVRFNETLTVNGWVGHEDAGAANVSAAVVADGEFLAVNRTDSNGTLQTNVSLPAAIDSGSQQVRLALLARDRALAPANGTTALQVAETPTELTVAATQTEGRTLRVSGQLEADTQGGVAGQVVEITANGTTLGTATTGPDGQFRTTVVVPDELLASGLGDAATTLNVQAAYQGSETNLGSSSASATALVTQAGILLWIGALVAGVLVLVGGYLGYRWWRRRSQNRDADRSPTIDEPMVSVTGDDGRTPDSLFGMAREQLAADRPDAAVELAYTGLRRDLERRSGIEEPATHWEFYRRYRRDGDEGSVETLRRATELYERAVFASRSVSSDSAAEILDTLDGIGSTGRSADD
ncbi:hypothetical protein SAMN05216388_10339 [Halorientalis persicus]|uniref:DUF4129 domain-containing protein n=1 Tax=Halorientalis persicus TaxID=1367881 RepID=A0A1H8V445_9EURY|nr:hypothetical protein [Halorientalis persicus]SEP10199.1 hypothetical protein SAMN05216388_10339 [Halorientalis persicus]